MANHQDFLKLIQKAAKENGCLPVGSNLKTRVFKEGQIKWNEIKSPILNQQKCDEIKVYAMTRTKRLFTHL